MISVQDKAFRKSVMHKVFKMDLGRAARYTVVFDSADFKF